jgi:hypothetical protein
MVCLTDRITAALDSYEVNLEEIDDRSNGRDKIGGGLMQDPGVWRLMQDRGAPCNSGTRRLPPPAFDARATTFLAVLHTPRPE